MTDEEKKAAIADAIGSYVNGKVQKNDRAFTLRDITDEEFVKLEKIDMKDSFSSIDSKENWYNQRYKQLREMMKAFDVWEEFTGLKRKGESYSFSQRNKQFILMLFREYNGKFEHLKRGKVTSSDGAYLLTVYNGILDIFYDTNAPESLIESVMLKLWNRLDIPQRNIDATIDSVCEQCKRMVKKNIESNSYGMGLMEKLVWQAAFRQSFYQFLFYWDSIGDVVMYGTFGICKIASIEKRDFMGVENDYYILHHVYNEKNTFYVPLDNEQAVSRLHKVCSKADVDELIGHMNAEAPIWIDNEIKRKEEYSRIIKGGDKKEIIRLIKALYLHRKELYSEKKKLRSSDENYLALAENMLFEEFAYALDIDRSEVVDYIEKHIA